MHLDAIIEAVESARVRITDHADEEAVADKLTYDDIAASVLRGEVIEAYPSDKPYPNCLIFGLTPSGVAVHSVWAYNSESGWAVLITVYRPDPARWVNWRERRRLE